MKTGRGRSHSASAKSMRRTEAWTKKKRLSGRYGEVSVLLYRGTAPGYRAMMVPLFGQCLHNSVTTPVRLNRVAH